ncbi:hypothetical protein KBC89_03255 [Candidatus Woesebacteria bacterium]|nr:hypothetical protein [Candidatus Woesebacteria bacterium]
MSTMIVSEIQPTEPGWESTYPGLANLILAASFDWLKRDENELLEVIENSLEKLNQELPTEFRIRLDRTHSNDSSVELEDFTEKRLGIFDSKGIRIFLTAELRRVLTIRSTEEAIKLIVQTASEIIRNTPTTATTFRQSLRNKLEEKYVVVDQPS